VFFHNSEPYFLDGHVRDEEDCIWHACYHGSKVLRISPQGQVIGEISLPTRNITCPVFAGTVLFITSAEENEPEKYPESAKNGGNVFRVDVGVKGRPKFIAKSHFT
jgi:sugar lactone lactonase YvrE